MKKLIIGLIGFGTVGKGVVEVINNNCELIKKRTGVELELKYICDLDITTERGVPLKNHILTQDYKEVISDKEVDIIIELVGGTFFARTLMLEALDKGKHIATANKALLAEHGDEIFACADKNNMLLGYEASVCGGIPIIQIVQNYLAGDTIESMFGILNGTSNFILTQMQEKELSFDEALSIAQREGFAEEDPRLDINGGDAIHKLAILSSIAFNCRVPFEKLSYKGISDVELIDFKVADSRDYNIKLIGLSTFWDEDSLMIGVFPALISKNHQLNIARNEFNAVLVKSKFLGESLYYGRGAGSQPTGLAVAADLISIAQRRFESSTFMSKGTWNNYKIIPEDEWNLPRYVRILLTGQISEKDVKEVFEKYKISIKHEIIESVQDQQWFIAFTEETKSVFIKDMINELLFMEPDTRIIDMKIID